MSVDEHEAQTCIRCGSPKVPCACDCEHELFTDGECEGCGIECDHDDVEDRECLVCGADLTEELCAMAYDMAKAARYDD